ncbi:MAG: glycosyltransferase [Gammaproteobacteria bacterium]|nr:glycosyltransferase [Gammaproteobacteria bacterium]
MMQNHNHIFKLINVVGIDGAGKTTLAKQLVKTLQKDDHKVRYAYCQYFAKLLYPIKLMARWTVMRRTNEFKNYKNYNQTKQGTSKKHPFFAGIYTLIWLVDYLVQVFFKVSLPLFIGRRLVLDRYLFDIAVNLSLTSGKPVEYAKKLIDFSFRFSPRPDYVFYIDLPEEIAFNRKDDIQDVAYLKERRHRYLWLAKAYGFTVLDGTKSINQVLKDALSILKPVTHRKKNILYVHANNLDIGGADYCLFKLASQLDKTKYRPVVCLSQKTKVHELYEKEGIKTHVIDMERIKKSANPFYLFKLIYKFFFTVRTLRKIIKQEQIDLVHGNDLLDIYGPVAGFLERKPSTQYVRWILESPVWLKTIITSIVYRLNTCVMTVSDAVALKMFAIASGIRSRVVTCYDWIDMDKVGHLSRENDLRAEYKLEETTPLVGCVGRLEHWKGQDVFIRAAAIVGQKRPDTKFLIVGGEVEGRGRESFGSYCRTLAKKLGIQDQVIFTGQRNDVAHLMDSLDVFVHASVTPDPLPGVVMEAMACATPVVGANAGGVPEEMSNRETGYLYPPGNAEIMADKIISLLDNPETAKSMGKAGHKRVHTVFEKKQLCQKIENIYERMIQPNQGQDSNKKTALMWTGMANPAGKGK